MLCQQCAAKDATVFPDSSSRRKNRRVALCKKCGEPFVGGPKQPEEFLAALRRYGLPVSSAHDIISEIVAGNARDPKEAYAFVREALQRALEDAAKMHVPARHVSATELLAALRVLALSILGSLHVTGLPTGES
jgi:hypothetical protein